MVDIKENGIAEELSRLINADLEPLKTLEAAINSKIDTLKSQGKKEDDIDNLIKASYSNWYYAYPSLMEHLIQAGIKKCYAKKEETIDSNKFKIITFDCESSFDIAREKLSASSVPYMSNDETFAVEICNSDKSCKIKECLSGLKYNESGWLTSEEGIKPDTFENQATLHIESPFDRTKGLWEIVHLKTGEKVFAKKRTLAQKVSENLGLGTEERTDVIKQIVCDFDGIMKDVKILRKLENNNYMVKSMDNKVYKVTEACLFPKFNLWG